MSCLCVFSNRDCAAFPEFRVVAGIPLSRRGCFFGGRSPLLRSRTRTTKLVMGAKRTDPKIATSNGSLC
jgi:hypothetical protein